MQSSPSTRIVLKKMFTLICSVDIVRGLSASKIGGFCKYYLGVSDNKLYERIHLPINVVGLVHSSIDSM